MPSSSTRWFVVIGASLLGLLMFAEALPSSIGAAGRVEDDEDYGLIAPRVDEEEDDYKWALGDNKDVALSRSASYRSKDDNELVRQAARLLQVLKEKAYTRPEPLKTRKRARAQKAMRINKRHCWDVADVCCMWNIC